MSSFLSDLANNLPNNLHKKKGEDCKCLLEYVKTEGTSLIYNCPKCKKTLGFEMW